MDEKSPLQKVEGMLGIPQPRKKRLTASGKAERLCELINKYAGKRMAWVRQPDSNKNKYTVTVSAEDYSTEESEAGGAPLADYYGEFRGGCPWIDPKVEKILKSIKRDAYFEWDDAGSITVWL